MALMILTGDVNLMNVSDASVPFRHVTKLFRSADMVFSNLECCLYAPDRQKTFRNSFLLTLPP